VHAVRAVLGLEVVDRGAHRLELMFASSIGMADQGCLTLEAAVEVEP